MIFRSQKPSGLPNYYRILQILNKQFNFCCRTLLPSMLLTFLVAGTCSAYGTVRLFHKAEMPAFLIFPMTTLGVIYIIIDTLPNSYQVYAGSKELLRNIKESSLGNPYMSKFIHSCQPLSVDVGSFFIVTQSTTMAVVSNIIDRTITLLLGF